MVYALVALAIAFVGGIWVGQEFDTRFIVVSAKKGWLVIKNGEVDFDHWENSAKKGLQEEVKTLKDLLNLFK